VSGITIAREIVRVETIDISPVKSARVIPMSAPLTCCHCRETIDGDLCLEVTGQNGIVYNLHPVCGKDDPVAVEALIDALAKFARGVVLVEQIP